MQAAQTSGPALHTVDEPKLNDSEPIHANSHAVHLKDPARTDTSGITKTALEENGNFDTVISALISPVSDGEDGDQVKIDFEEKTLR